MIGYIGFNAGLVWQALDQSKKPMDVKTLKKVTKIRTEKDVYAAIGWLAKEDKLEFEGDEKDFLVSLK